jgi:hypothetical protein
MRVLVLLTLAAVFATAALGLMAPATQEQAKALRDNWKNCSQVVRGRLGALASETAPTEGLRIAAMNNTDVEVLAYTPCVASWDSTEQQNQFLSVTVWQNGTHSVIPAPFTYNFELATNPQQIVQFVMPSKKGDVAHFVGSYYARANTVNKNGVKFATVTTNCGDTSDVATGYVEDDTVYVTLTNINACSRFPYTNGAMPSGAIAALIIILVVFALELGVCGWYHKTYVHDTPFSSGREDVYHHE